MRSLGNLTGVELDSLLDLSRLSDQAHLQEDSISRYHDARVFHVNLAQLTGNPFLYRAVANFYDLTWILRHRDSLRAEQSVDNAVQHKQIAHALAIGDVEEARVLMVDHLTQVMRTSVETMVDDSLAS